MKWKNNFDVKQDQELFSQRLCRTIQKINSFKPKDSSRKTQKGNEKLLVIDWSGVINNYGRLESAELILM